MHGRFTSGKCLYILVTHTIINFSDVDRTAYVTLLVKFLEYLHFIVEQWSRMDDMQEILVKCGAFYLLLNELHTAPSTDVSFCCFGI